MATIPVWRPILNCAVALQAVFSAYARLKFGILLMRIRAFYYIHDLINRIEALYYIQTLFKRIPAFYYFQVLFKRILASHHLVQQQSVEEKNLLRGLALSQTSSRGSAKEGEMQTFVNSWCINIPSNNEEDNQDTPNRSGDWSELNSDVLGLILGRLGPFDHLRFGCVCRAWRRTRLTHGNSPQGAHLQGQLQAPMLLLCASDDSDHRSSRRQFLNPSDGRTYTFSLVDLSDHICIGSHGSWLVMEALSWQRLWYNPFDLNNDLYLYNPFNATKFNLPHQRGTDFKRCVIAISSEPFSRHFAVLAADPLSTMLYWIRADESRWSSRRYVDANRGRFVQLVAVGGEFYGLTMYGRLAQFNLDHRAVLVWRDDVGVVPGFDWRRDDPYLVECEGELLAVIVSCPRAHGCIEPSLRVFRLDSTKKLGLCAWIDAGEMVKDKDVYLGRRGGSLCRRGAAATGKVYTAGMDSFGVFDVRTGEGSVLCGGDPGAWRWINTGRRNVLVPEDPGCWQWAVWVLPELIYGDRTTSRWVAVGNQAAFYVALVVHITAMGLALAGFYSLVILLCQLLKACFSMLIALW